MYKSGKVTKIGGLVDEFGNWRIFVYWLKCDIANLIFAENNAFPAGFTLRFYP